MTIRAKISVRYLLRAGIIAVVCIGFFFWCLYDAKVKYPNQMERAKKFEKLKAEERLGEWDALADERGWSRENPGKPKTEGDIWSQYIFAAISGPVGLLFLFFFLRARGSWMEASDTGINTSWGEQFEHGQITMLDKKNWKKKGIAKVTYQQDARTRRLTLDDCKYDFEETEKILRQMEANIPVEQIVNGSPEPPPEELAEQQADVQDAAKVEAGVPQDSN